MPISVARKIQAHICGEFHDLNVRLIKVGLTFDQVIEYDLPDSPLKSTERRAQAWLERWWPERVKAAEKIDEKAEGGQVEIDALAALRPTVLDRIARDAVAPYFDPTYEDRYTEAVAMSAEQAAWFKGHSVYKTVSAAIQKAYKVAAKAVTALETVRVAAVDAMRRVVKSEGSNLPDVIVAPRIGDEPEDAVFDSGDDFVAATLKLKALKALSVEEALSIEDDDDDSVEDDDDD